MVVQGAELRVCAEPRQIQPPERSGAVEGSRGGVEIEQARLGRGEAEPELGQTAFQGCRHGLCGQALELCRGFGGKFAAAGDVAGGGMGGGEPGVDPDQKARAAYRDTRLADDAAGATVVSQCGTLVSAAKFDVAEAADAEGFKAGGVDVLVVAQGFQGVQVLGTAGVPRACASVGEGEKSAGADKAIDEVRLASMRTASVRMRIASVCLPRKAAVAPNTIHAAWNRGLRRMASARKEGVVRVAPG